MRAASARSFSDANAGGGNNRRRASSGARSFSRSSLSGNRPGRPTTNTTYQFAGDPDRLTPQAQQLIASKRWEQRRGRDKPETAPRYSSISSGADVSALRGAYRSERRFAGERGGFPSQDQD